jgi:hypothetical protein
MDGFLELNIRRFTRDGTAQSLAPEDVPGQSGGVIWLDFLPSSDSEAVGRAVDAMQLQGLDRGMLGYLLNCIDPAGYGAEGVIWYDADVAAELVAGNSVRYLRTFALRPDVPPGPLSADDELPMVYRREVHFLASEHWVITRRRRGMAITRGVFDEEADAVSHEELLTFLRAHWDDYHEPQDVALLIMRALAATWIPALDPIGDRLGNGDLLYVQGPLQDRALVDERRYRIELVDMKWVVGGLSSLFRSLQRPGIDAKDAWFPAKTPRAVAVAVQIANLLALATADLTDKREQVRSSFELVAATETSRQMELGNEERRRGERLERVVTFVTVVLLVPTLVAGTFAALPDAWHKRPQLRAGVLLGLMFVGAAAAWGVLAIVRARANAEPGAGNGGNKAGERTLPVEVWLAVLVFAALAFACSWRAANREAALAVVLLAIAGFLVLPSFGLGSFAGALTKWRLVQWAPLAASGVVSLIGSFKIAWAGQREIFLTVGFGLGVALCALYSLVAVVSRSPEAGEQPQHLDWRRLFALLGAIAGLALAYSVAWQH